MRVYVPATMALLDAPDGVVPESAHAVTPALAAALPEEDDEGLEYAALLAAADESVRLIAADPVVSRLRVVLAADVDAPTLTARTDALPSSVLPPAHVPWTQVVSIHVDEGDAVRDVAAAAAGDDVALDRAAERDLLWYDVSELDVLRALGDH